MMKFQMQKFTEKIVGMMKEERLYETRGGPIILSQSSAQKHLYYSLYSLCHTSKKRIGTEADMNSDCRFQSQQKIFGNVDVMLACPSAAVKKLSSVEETTSAFLFLLHRRIFPALLSNGKEKTQRIGRESAEYWTVEAIGSLHCKSHSNPLYSNPSLGNLSNPSLHCKSYSNPPRISSLGTLTSHKYDVPPKNSEPIYRF
ncbi:hypothetical protein P8452_22275 [Trifolium repens]|nr:hypothetical protein P8452_22275 [Trifolium repens]